jgi:hypothetical protein
MYPQLSSRGRLLVYHQEKRDCLDNVQVWSDGVNIKLLGVFSASPIVMAAPLCVAVRWERQPLSSWGPWRFQITLGQTDVSLDKIIVSQVERLASSKILHSDVGFVIVSCRYVYDLCAIG